MITEGHLVSPADRHPNPWDSNNGAWMCSCADCTKTRSAWPDTTALWRPMAGHIVDFGAMVRGPHADPTGDSHG